MAATINLNTKDAAIPKTLNFLDQTFKFSPRLPGCVSVDLPAAA
jgi:hypothetical protein